MLEKQRKRSSIENAFRILNLFSIDEPEMSVTTISQKLNVPKSTTYRLLSSLLQEEFLHKNPNTSRYSLGTSILSLVNIVNSQIHIANESVPFLNKLVEETGENAHLAILDNGETVYIQTMKGVYTFSDEGKIQLGTRRDAVSTAAGRILLAFHPNPTEKTLLAGNVIQELEEIKKQGYALLMDAYQKNETEIAIPVFDEPGQVIASLSITANSKRVQSYIQIKPFLYLLNQAGEGLRKVIELRKRGKKVE
ncbi:IclR family transcriptional regulator [Pseudogracilibacillus sp. SO30301A]|uniref:IclR family transcriptional regulator n=1 Tax=Pseudogracilibacillus sp. SO30301A TaxID=3098291 RepID=UPI00300DD581